LKDKEAAQAHCQLGANSIFNEEIFNWLDGVMGEGAGATTTAPMFKLHHMGVVVRNLDEAVEIYADILGLDPVSAGSTYTVLPVLHVGGYAYCAGTGVSFGQDWW